MSGGDRARISPARLEAIVRLHENSRKRASARLCHVKPVVFKTRIRIDFFWIRIDFFVLIVRSHVLVVIPCYVCAFVLVVYSF